MRQRTPITVGQGRAPTQLDRLACQHRGECSARSEPGIGAHPRLAGARQRRHLDSRETDLAPVIERKAATVQESADRCGPDRLQSAG